MKDKLSHYNIIFFTFCIPCWSKWHSISYLSNAMLKMNVDVWGMGFVCSYKHAKFWQHCLFVNWNKLIMSKKKQWHIIQDWKKFAWIYLYEKQVMNDKTNFNLHWHLAERAKCCISNYNFYYFYVDSRSRKRYSVWKKP